MDKVREALERGLDKERHKARWEGMGTRVDVAAWWRQWALDLESNAREALNALTQPQPEAREEDEIESLLREWLYELAPLDACEPSKWTTEAIARDYRNLANKTESFLSRLAAKEGQISDTRERRCSECRFFNSVTGKCKITLEDAGACFVKYGHSLWTPVAPATSEKPEEGKR